MLPTASVRELGRSVNQRDGWQLGPSSVPLHGVPMHLSPCLLLLTSLLCILLRDQMHSREGSHSSPLLLPWLWGLQSPFPFSLCLNDSGVASFVHWNTCLSGAFLRSRSLWTLNKSLSFSETIFLSQGLGRMLSTQVLYEGFLVPGSCTHTWL